MDLEFIRRQFPALESDWILFENAGGTQVPVQVVRRVEEFFRTANVQPHYRYPHSERATETLEQARQFVAEWIHAPAARQIAFGPSATTLNRLMAQALVRLWREGDEIIVTVSDHEANITPWLYLEEFGLKVKFWPVNRETFRLELEELERLLTERTVLVAFPHISNVLGYENPVAEIARLAHEAEAMVYVDGVASMPHRPVNVQAWDVDFFVFSTYKTFGPHMAAIYGKEDIWLRMPTLNHLFLGNQIPLKFELGTPNLEGAAALLGVRDYLLQIFEHHSLGDSNWPLSQKLYRVMEQINQHEHGLAERLLEGLRELPQILLHGPDRPDPERKRVPVVGFSVQERHPDEIARALVEQKIAVGHGDFYARRIVDFLGFGRTGILRASLVHYNTVEEIDRFLNALRALL
jgi:cysteine desulfurase family protein (TIGR01976 family)